MVKTTKTPEKPKLELCLWVDKNHPGQKFAKRYYVDEVIHAVENGQYKPGWFETSPSIGFQFTPEDFSWVRVSEVKKRKGKTVK